MPITTEITEDFQGIVQTGRGLVTGEDFVEACQAAFQLVQNTKNFHYEFVDLTEATALQFSAEHLEKITERDRLAAVYRPDAIVVIAAPRDDFYQLSKVWEARVRELGWSTHITRERSEALKWLQENFPRRPIKSASETASNSSSSSTKARNLS